MKNILITGAGSYIGVSLENYLGKWPENYRVDSLDMRGTDWENHSFRGYDAVFHVAGLVHQPDSKNDPARSGLYDQVNHILAVRTAEKAKADGVGQFLFMSSESVYGLTAPIGKTVVITKNTPLHPADNYGVSKARAEADLQALADDSFKVAILRPPMIYGKGCKGNYVTMAKLAKKLPVFPYVANQRSMLYIENLTEFVRLLIDDEAAGIFCPQNNEYTNTSDMVNWIAPRSVRTAKTTQKTKASVLPQSQRSSMAAPPQRTPPVLPAAPPVYRSAIRAKPVDSACSCTAR